MSVSNAITSRGVRKSMTIYIWLDTEFSGGVQRKKTDRFWFKKWVLFTQKSHFLNEDVKKRRKRERGKEEQHDVW